MPKEIEFILKDFVRHVVDLKAEDDPAGTGFHREFRILREEQIQNKNEDRFPTEDGKKEINLKKNRYKDILPRDDRRVKLTEIEGEKGSDYINSSFIDDVNGKRGYIAAQGPMPHTVYDFWRMLWQYNTEIVFMVCKLKEDGRPKCEKYWANSGESATFGDITVHTESEEEIREDFYRRQMRAERDGESHTLTQFHYVGWPDHNTPSSPDILRSMIEDVRNFRKHPDIPMVVHCSAGCGRTGTICAIDFAWTLLERGMITEEFSMFEIIKAMREQRMSMVQTPDQYEYTHMVMKSLCNEWLVSFSEHDYENISYGRAVSDPEDDVEETYANIEFEDGKKSEEDCSEAVKEKVITVPEMPRESQKLVTTSQPAAGAPPPVTAQEPAEVKPKPEAPAQKPQAGETVVNASSSRATMVIADKPGDTGEYVEVLKTATVPPLSKEPPKTSVSSTSEVQKKSSAPASDSSGSETQKKTSTTTTAPAAVSVAAQKSQSAVGSDTNSFDPHKTVIMLGGSNATPKIIKSGSVGVSHTKQQAPKPPAQAVVKPIVVEPLQQKPIVVLGQQQGKQQQTAANDSKGVDVVKIKPAADVQNSGPQTSGGKTSSSAMSDEEAPDLPSRNYRPEEISSPPNSPKTTIAVAPVQQHMATATAKVSTTSPPQTLPSPTFPAEFNRDRPQQPLPVNHPPAQGVQVISARSGHVVSTGAVVSAKSMGHMGNARPGAQAVGTKPGGHHSQNVPGMVSVVIGAASQQQTASAVRPAAAKSSDTRSVGHATQPVLVHSHGKGPAPRRGPLMVQPAHHPHHAHPAGARSHHAVPAAVAGQVVRTAQGGKIVYLTDRPPRVKGPKSMPADWSVPGKNPHGGTFL